MSEQPHTMRILHVIPFFTPSKGGSARVAYQMAHLLGERGHDVTVVASDVGVDEASFPPGPFEVTLLKATIARWGFYLTPSLPHWIAGNIDRFDVVHLHEVRTFQNAITRHYAIRHQKPYVLSAHGTLPIIVQRQVPKQIYDRIVGNRLVADAARLLAVSPFELDQYTAAGIARDRMRLILNGIDLCEFETLPPRGLLRKRYAISEESPIVLYLGRLHQTKGINITIDAFARIRQDQSNTMLMISGPDDGELAALKKQVAALRLDDSVYFTGPLYGEDKLSAYVDADVLVSPASHEIFGLVPFEALMCGTPVVVARNNGSGQLISEAQAGYLVRYGDIPGLADAMQQALTQQAQTEAMVQAGQTFIRNNLQWPTIVEKLEQVYAELISAA